MIIEDSVVKGSIAINYLGVVLDDKLNWVEHISYVDKRLKPRLYCLGNLNSFNINPDVLALFYNSVICSAWTYCLSCWEVTLVTLN